MKNNKGCANTPQNLDNTATEPQQQDTENNVQGQHFNEVGEVPDTRVPTPIELNIPISEDDSKDIEIVIADADVEVKSHEEATLFVPDFEAAEPVSTDAEPKVNLDTLSADDMNLKTLMESFEKAEAEEVADAEADTVSVEVAYTGNVDYPIITVEGKLFQEEKNGTLHKTTAQVMSLKYGNRYKKEVEHFLTFTTEPSHTNHKRVIKNKYNLYKKLSHVPKKGEWKTIELLLKHIFKGDSSYRMILEYFYNCYVNPQQKLPFIGLVSEKKNTGKTTFLDFIELMFEGNATFISEHDLTSNFNALLPSSLFLLSDEHSEGKSRKKIAQRLKMMVTAKTIRTEQKGIDAKNAKTFFKIVFCGNDEEMLTDIEVENTRYWIVRTESLEQEILNIKEELKKEIPAFLYFLINEFEPRKSRGRLYFAPAEFQTEAAAIIQKNSISDMHKTILDLVETTFQENSNADELYFAPKDILEALGLHLSKKAYVTKVLKKQMKLNPCGSMRYKQGQHLRGGYAGTVTGTPYLFKRSDFIDN